MGEFFLLAILIMLLTWCLWPMIAHHRGKKISADNKK
jgi:hypothetical protein